MCTTYTLADLVADAAMLPLDRASAPNGVPWRDVWTALGHLLPLLTIANCHAAMDDGRDGFYGHVNRAVYDLVSGTGLDPQVLDDLWRDHDGDPQHLGYVVHPDGTPRRCPLCGEFTVPLGTHRPAWRKDHSPRCEHPDNSRDRALWLARLAGHSLAAAVDSEGDRARYLALMADVHEYRSSAVLALRGAK